MTDREILDLLADLRKSLDPVDEFIDTLYAEGVGFSNRVLAAKLKLSHAITIVNAAKLELAKLMWVDGK